MKCARVFLWGAAGLGLLLIIVAGLASTSGIQTWAVRRMLASRPDLGASVEHVSISPGRIHLEKLVLNPRICRFEAPVVDIELSLWGVLRNRLQIAAIRAKEWSLDVKSSGAQVPSTAFPKRSSTTWPSLLSTAYATEESKVIPWCFGGVFPMLVMPYKLAVGTVDLEGSLSVLVCEGQPPARAAVSISGGGLGAGQEGRFEIQVLTTQAGDVMIEQMQVHGSAVVRMDGDSRFTQLGLVADAEAKGRQLPQGARLNLILQANQNAAGEAYSLRLISQDRILLSAQGELPGNTGRLIGSWSLNASDSDVAPFLLGRPIPLFRANGEGGFASDVAGLEQKIYGRLTANLDRLQTLRRELVALGAVSLSSEFDFLRRGSVVRITQLRAEVSGVKQVGFISLLQGFEFDTSTRALKVADPQQDLVRLELTGLPLSWVQPYFSGYTFSGGELQGAFVLRAHSGGFALRATKPLQTSELDISNGDCLLAKGVGLSATIGADYTPKGWQAEISELGLRDKDRTILSFSARAGQLSDDGQVMKVAGQWNADVPLLLAQPLFAGFPLKLAKGSAKGQFAASFASAAELQLHAESSQCRMDGVDGVLLPDVLTDLRADVSPEGIIEVKCPIKISNSAKQRSSDLLFAGSLKPVSGNVRVTGRLMSQSLVLEDILAFSSPFIAAREVQPVAKTSQNGDQNSEVQDPVWSGVEGELGLSLHRIQLSPQSELTDFVGTLKADAASLRIDTLKASLDSGASLASDVIISFSPKKRHYALKLDFSSENLESRRLFEFASVPGAPVVDARFSVNGRLSGSSDRLSDLLENVTGSFKVISKGGALRLLAADINEVFLSKPSTTLGSITAGLGSLLGKNGDSKEAPKLDDNMRAASDFAEYCACVPFDQLSMTLVRDQDLNLRIQDLALISPILRISGAGVIHRDEAKHFWAQSLELNLEMGVRGKHTDQFGKAGLLDGKQDGLGYRTVNLPLKVRGCLSNPDNADMKVLFRKLSFPKSSEAFFDRILGNK